MKVFITDGNTRAALAITRSLGREGAEVIVGAEKHPCLASRSRYCNKEFLYPDPRIDYQQFTEAICRAVKIGRPDILLPVTDITTMMVTENKADLSNYCAVPFPDYESVSQAADKFNLMKLAEGLGIPIPRTIYLEGPTNLEVAYSHCCSIGYPIVVKPSRSRIRTETGWKISGVLYAKDEKELKAILAESGDHKEFPLLLQERVQGEGVGVFLCIDRGEVVAAFSHKRLREKPPSGGVSVLRESIFMQPELRDYSKRLLKTLNWQGVAMVEFKRESSTGQYKLMEINGRFWGSLQLAIDSGVDFPTILAKIAVGEKISPIRDYRIGVKTRWFWGDVDVLLSILFKSKKALKLPPGFPSRWRSFLDFMHFKGKDLHYEVFNREDIGPFLYETRSRFLK
ncbi:MAG: ATP-grasp domain-containing protein [Deltaproteobacteria bacterium]|nr:ATP-grasp domain-containing protein [Deltaproteobacteria bacterium]